MARNSINMMSISKMRVFEYLPDKRTRSFTPYLTSIPAEVRFEILKHLLPDLDSVPFRPHQANMRPSQPQDSPSSDSSEFLDPPVPFRRNSQYVSLRKDGASCHPAIMETCRQIYEECMSIIFAPNRVFQATLKQRKHVAVLNCVYLNPWKLTRSFGETDEDYRERLAPLVKLLDHIRSLHLMFPPNELQPYHFSGDPAAQSFASLVVENFPDRIPFSKLIVEFTPSDRSLPDQRRPPPPHRRPIIGAFVPTAPPPPPPPGAGNYLSVPPLSVHGVFVDEAYLKWIVQPLHMFFGFKPGNVRFLFHGEPIEELDDPNSPLPEVVNYTRRLCRKMSREERQCTSGKLPPAMQAMSRLMTCYWSVDSARRSVCPDDPPQHYADSRRAKVQDRRYAHSDLWLWDRWDRDAWDEIEEEYDILKAEWERLKEGMDAAYAGLDASFAGLKEGRMIE